MTTDQGKKNLPIRIRKPACHKIRVCLVRTGTQAHESRRTWPMSRKVLGMTKNTVDTQATIEHRITGLIFDHVQDFGIHWNDSGSRKLKDRLCGSSAKDEADDVDPDSIVLGSGL